MTQQQDVSSGHLVTFYVFLNTLNKLQFFSMIHQRIQKTKALQGLITIAFSCQIAVVVMALLSTWRCLQWQDVHT